MSENQRFVLRLSQVRKIKATGEKNIFRRFKKFVSIGEDSLGYWGGI